MNWLKSKYFGAADLASLPSDKTFGQSLPAYVLPYGAYVLALASTPYLGNAAAYTLAFFGSVFFLLRYRREYQFGPLPTSKDWVGIIGLTLIGLAIWSGILYGTLTLLGQKPRIITAGFSGLDPLYFTIRLIASVFAVPVFEELLCRIYLLEWFSPASGKSMQSTFSLDRLDNHPNRELNPELGYFAILMVSLLFALGHSAMSIPAAVVWFVLTSLYYKRSKNLLAIMLIHGLTNLGVALLAGPFGWRFLWD